MFEEAEVTKIVSTIMMALLLASCGKIFSNISIENRGDAPLTRVSVQAGTHRYVLSDVPPHTSMTFSKYLPGEGGAILSWSYDARQYRHELCYFTGGMPAKGKIIILPNQTRLECS